MMYVVFLHKSSETEVLQFRPNEELPRVFILLLHHKLNQFIKGHLLIDIEAKEITSRFVEGIHK